MAAAGTHDQPPPNPLASQLAYPVARLLLLAATARAEIPGSHWLEIKKRKGDRAARQCYSANPRTEEAPRRPGRMTPPSSSPSAWRPPPSPALHPLRQARELAVPDWSPHGGGPSATGPHDAAVVIALSLPTSSIPSSASSSSSMGTRRPRLDAAANNSCRPRLAAAGAASSPRDQVAAETSFLIGSGAERKRWFHIHPDYVYLRLAASLIGETREGDEQPDIYLCCC